MALPRKHDGGDNRGKNRGKKKSASSIPSLRPSCLMRILPGRNHPKVFCSQGNGGFPVLRLLRGAPDLGVSVPTWSNDPRVSLQHPDDLSLLGLPGFPGRSTEQPRLSGPSCRGRSPCGSRSLNPLASPVSPEGVGCRPPIACQQEAFRRSPASWRSRAHSLSRGRPFARPLPCCRSSADRGRW